jgi:hypothetical protein
MAITPTDRVLFWGILLCVAACVAGISEAAAEKNSGGDSVVGQWGIYEITLHGPASGNPFDDVKVSAQFTCGSKTVDANGFYDGDGIYRIRFMPMVQGQWSYQTRSNVPELSGKTGQFTCGAPEPGNHGPVGVVNHFHFAYADGTPYFECGTTAYEWTSQPTTRESQTLETLKGSAFNKIRMCVFPTEYKEDNIPARWPFEPADLKADYSKFSTEKKEWNFARLNPAFFRNFEEQVKKLGDEGIEADVILFHPYAKVLGFSTMPADADDRYLHYVIARLAAYHNVWWSLANEFDHLHAKKTEDWDRFFQIIVKDDPYGHLRGIQQSPIVYNKPWMTHASIQASPAEKAAKDRALYDKPVVFDEIKYEGDIPPGWGHLRAEDMVDRFWMATVLGTYAGHGETFMTNGWSGVGGVLTGKSPQRLAFYRRTMESSPAEGIEPIDRNAEATIGGQAGEFYFVYFGRHAPPKDWVLKLPAKGLAAGTQMHVDVIDTWNMTTTPVDQVFTMSGLKDGYVTAENGAVVAMPDRPGILLRVTRVVGK